MNQESRIPDLLRRAGSARPDSIALEAFGRSPLSYRLLIDQITRVAQALSDRGIRRGDAVAIVMGDGPDLATAFLGVSAAATAAPLNPRYRKDEFDFHLADLHARAVIVEAGSSSPVREVAARHGIAVLEVAPASAAGAGELTGGPVERDGSGAPPAFGADVALALHTSGTTGRPKIVPLSHRNLIASAVSVQTTLGLREHDRCLTVMPLFHVHGLVAATLAPLFAGGTLICTPGFTAAHALDWLEASGATWYTAVPAMHQAILARAAVSERPFRHRLRFIRSASAALPTTVAAALEHTFGVPVIETYGMTEAAHQVASNPLPPAGRKAGSVGLPAGPDIAVLDPEGRPVPAGARGEIAIRGRNVVAGYYGRDDRIDAAFAGGWFRTGDLGRLDEDGYLYIDGRLKEIINRAGEKIAPREVDDALLGHPAVLQAVTFGYPDERLGEDVASAVVLRPGATVSQRDLRHFVSQRLALFKVPSVIQFVDAIPSGPTGKTQRLSLAARLGVGGSRASARLDPDGRGSTGWLEERLAVMCAEVLGRQHIGVYDDFVESGGDSLSAMQFVARVSDWLAMDLSIVDFLDPDGVTVANLAKVIKTRQVASVGGQ